MQNGNYHKVQTEGKYREKKINELNYRTLKARDRNRHGDYYHYDIQGKAHIIHTVHLEHDYHPL